MDAPCLSSCLKFFWLRQLFDFWATLKKIFLTKNWHEVCVWSFKILLRWHPRASLRFIVKKAFYFQTCPNILLLKDMSRKVWLIYLVKSELVGRFLSWLSRKFFCSWQIFDKLIPIVSSRVQISPCCSYHQLKDSLLKILRRVSNNNLCLKMMFIIL